MHSFTKLNKLFDNIFSINKQENQRKNKMNTDKKHIVITVSTALAVSACGGGGGGGSTPTVQSTNPQVIRQTIQTEPVKPQSQLAKQSAEAVALAKVGKNAKIMVIDWGVDGSDPAIINSNVEKQQYLYNSETQKVEKANLAEHGYKHGTNMNKIVLQNAPETTIINYAMQKDHADIYAKTSYQGLLTAAELTAQDKSIAAISNSYAGDSAGDKSLLIPVIEEIVQNGALFVKATGNTAHNQPKASSEYLDDTEILRSGVLLVTGTSNGETIFNQCGDTKDHCVSAPALYQMTDKNGKPYQTTGTSNATAAVAALAGQIKANFDWMKAKELKETIITTSIDKGEAGNDGVWGAGEINPDAAIRGYGRLDNLTTLNVDGVKDTYYFDNNISGKGAIRKQGQDTLVLNGNNTFTGTNQIEQGKLVLNGTNQAASHIGVNGVLAVGDAQNISSGSITNNGKLEANTTSDLVINGNLTQNAGSTLEKAIGSKVDVKGKATIDGSHLVVSGVAQGYTTQAGKTETLLQAKQIEGQFASTQVAKISDLISGSVQTTATQVNVKTQRATVGSVALPQSAYVGKDTAIENVETVLSQYDNKVDNGQMLSVQEAALATQLLSSQNISQTLFELGTNTEKHAQENVGVGEIEQNQRFLRNALAQKDATVWVDYHHAQADLALTGLNGSSKDHTSSVGVSLPLNDKHRVALSASQFDYQWNERFQQASRQLKTKGSGLDMAYIYQHDDNQLYATAGYNWLRNQNDWDKAKGQQYQFGLGISKWLPLNERVAIQPHMNVQYVDTQMNGLNVANQVSVNGMNIKQTTVQADLNAYYQASPTVRFSGLLGLSQDVYRKSRYEAIYAGSVLENRDSDLAKTRYQVGLGVQYSPIENISIYLNGKHMRGNHWKQSSVDTGLRYRF